MSNVCAKRLKIPVPTPMAPSPHPYKFKLSHQPSLHRNSQNSISHRPTLHKKRQYISTQPSSDQIYLNKEIHIYGYYDTGGEYKEALGNRGYIGEQLKYEVGIYRGGKIVTNVIVRDDL